ncbi:hypothetical protein E2C01_078637 [Portunus trituberculatus]|uniref:Uncharacterized protein n=1 Tax=Portunus trituberculatus TaxID=210409 RepID=A0A5B7INB4_PORTR|nr:hypothetical protein [Portunus trituberculatus]
MGERAGERCVCFTQWRRRGRRREAPLKIMTGRQVHGSIAAFFSSPSDAQRVAAAVVMIPDRRCVFSVPPAAPQERVVRGRGASAVRHCGISSREYCADHNIVSGTDDETSEVEGLVAVAAQGRDRTGEVGVRSG